MLTTVQQGVKMPKFLRRKYKIKLEAGGLENSYHSHQDPGVWTPTAFPSYGTELLAWTLEWETLQPSPPQWRAGWTCWRSPRRWSCTLYRQVSLGRLGVHCVKIRAMAMLIQTFLTQAISPSDSHQWRPGCSPCPDPRALKGEHWSTNMCYGRQERYVSKISSMEIIHLNASCSTKSLPKNASFPPPSWS